MSGTDASGAASRGRTSVLLGVAILRLAVLWAPAALVSAGLLSFAINLMLGGPADEGIVLPLVATVSIVIYGFLTEQRGLKDSRSGGARWILGVLFALAGLFLFCVVAYLSLLIGIANAPEITN